MGQMRDQQVFWNEQYLLYAYLTMNPRTRVVYGSRYHGIGKSGFAGTVHAWTV